MITLTLNEREYEVIRQALRTAESQYKKGDFLALQLEAEELRNKLADTLIELHLTKQ
jgi:hypothetical protein